MTKQTIHYKYLKDGKQAFKDVVRSVVFERVARVNLVTGAVIYDNWKITRIDDKPVVSTPAKPAPVVKPKPVAPVTPVKPVVSTPVTPAPVATPQPVAPVKPVAPAPVTPVKPVVSTPATPTPAVQPKPVATTDSKPSLTPAEALAAIKPTDFFFTNIC